MADAPTLNKQALTDRFDAFNQDLITFVESCSTADWQQITPAEGWPVGVTARHIGVGHYPLVAWVKLIVDGEAIPEVTMEAINQINDQHAIDHRDCTKTEVLEILRTNIAETSDYLASLDDAALARQTYVPLFDADYNAGDLFQFLLIDIANTHLDSMKAAVKS